MKEKRDIVINSDTVGVQFNKTGKFKRWIKRRIYTGTNGKQYIKYNNGQYYTEPVRGTHDLKGRILYYRAIEPVCLVKDDNNNWIYETKIT